MQTRRLSPGKKLVLLAIVAVCSLLVGGAALARTGAPRSSSVPTISGSPTVGQLLQGSPGTWNGLTPMTFGYSWKRCNTSGRSCTAITGATSPTYALTPVDLGTRIRLAVTAVNSAGSNTARSAPTAIVTTLSVPAPATAPANTAAPTINGTAESGQTFTASAGSWSGSTPMSYAYQWKRCDASGSSCSNVYGATGQSYTLASADVGYTVRAAVSASNSAGTASAVSAPTAAISSAPSPSGPVGSGTVFSTEPSAASGLPRSDSYCASSIVPNSWEPRPDNYPANSTVPADPSAVPWDRSNGWPYWTKWMAKLDKVTGNYTGTTTEIIQWAACKWGIDEDLIRAVALQESSWHQSSKGDYANGYYHSFGLMSIRDSTNSSPTGAHNAFGGYPDTYNHTALNVDFFGANMRSCYDGDFYDGGSWLYGGQTVQQIAAAHGWDYVLWGCIGSWYSGGWYDSGATTYINSVKTWLAQKTWLTY